MRSIVLSIKALLLLLAIALSQLSVPTASSESSLLIEVEIISSLIIVESYFCIDEYYASIEAVGSPLAVLLVIPQHVYVTIEGGNISVLATKQPECVRVRYVSEAVYSGNSLRITYSKRVSKMTVIMNLSTALPTYISPEPVDAYIVKEKSIAIVWVDTEGITLEYILIEYPRPDSTPTATTQPTAETERYLVQTIVNQTLITATPKETREAENEAMRIATVLAGLFAVLAVVLLVLKHRR
ncbi:MAG: hypothetical protein QXT76_07155 [Sulfolobales archaeon]